MKRRVILVDFYWTRDKDPRVPLGHASILSSLAQSERLEVHSIVMAVNEGLQSPEAIANRILALTQGVTPGDCDIAFGAYVWGESLLQEVLHLLRTAGFRGRIILGGPQISYSGPGLEALYPQVDAFIRGYGEEALKTLAESAEGRAITGVHWAGTPDAQAQAAINLEALPSPWLSGVIPLQNQAFIRWETQRGCPFQCSFCQHREAGARLKKSNLNLPRIEAEIDLFCHSGVKDIAILDPIFNVAPHAVGVLERFVSHGFQGRLSLQCRAEALTVDFLEAAQELDVCLEFGLQTIHKDEGKAVKRNNHMDKVDWALSEVRKRRIDHEVSLIFGLPQQTLASFEESVEWCLIREVPVTKAFPLMLLRGTGLDRERATWGFRDSGGAMPMVLSSNSFTEAQWRQMACLSEALKATEGRHPTSLGHLKALAATLRPEVLRWMPAEAPQAGGAG